MTLLLLIACGAGQGPILLIVPEFQSFFLYWKKSFSLAFQAPALSWVNLLNLLKISWQIGYGSEASNVEEFFTPTFDCWKFCWLLVSTLPLQAFSLYLSQAQDSGSSVSKVGHCSQEKRLHFAQALSVTHSSLEFYLQSSLVLQQQAAFGDVFLVVLIRALTCYKLLYPSQ